jgi:hypothetical protein
MAMASGAFTFVTVQQAIAAVSARLVDVSMVRWTYPELLGYLQEALQTWSALTECFHETGVFSSSGTTAFYDLSVVLPLTRGYTITDQQWITSMVYTLLEPPIGSTWNIWPGTSQFTLADLTSALQNRRDQFLRETGAVLTRQVLPISPPPDGRIWLPEAVAEVRRAAWLSTPDTILSPLLRDDEWGFNHFNQPWVQTPTRPPEFFSVGTSPPLILQLSPPPQDTGALDLVSINRGVTLTPSVSPTLLGVPDDWAWVVKFGALADVLSKDGLSQDLGRAAYFESRFQHGVKLAQLAAVVLTARINNVTCLVDALSDVDTYFPLWQTTPNTVARLLTAGQNLVALVPPPGTLPGGETWSITLDVVANAPIPWAGSASLPIGPEVYDVLLDYCEHLALMKEGAQQIDQAQPLLERFLRAAGVTLRIERNTVPERQALRTQGADPTRTAPLLLTSDVG